MSGVDGVRIKVCCIRDVREAALAIDGGASAIGLVSRMPSGPGVVDDATIAEVAAAVRARPENSRAPVVLLTVETTAEAIADQAQRLWPTGVPLVDAVQLVDAVPEHELRSLRERLPEVSIMPVIHVTGPEAVERARALAPFSDALLLDSGRPEAAVRELGGTGRTHDWETSRELVSAVDVPVWLAGGLRPENVADAIRVVRPYGVDVCSGLRPDGENLDPSRLAHFVAAVERA